MLNLLLSASLNLKTVTLQMSKVTLLTILVWAFIIVTLPKSCDKDLGNEEAKQQQFIK